MNNPATISNLANLTECNVRAFIEVKNAYNECDPKIQEGIDEMMAIFRDSETDEDEKRMAMNTIIEALFPGLAADIVESEKQVMESDEAQAYEHELDEEERVFAERLQKAMKKKNMTQKQLAIKAGISQPAISNMLHRCCRPQQRTVERFAKALGVTAEDLWPR